MHPRSLSVSLFLGLAAANLQAQTATSTSEKCGNFSNIITIQVVPCDPPTAAEMLPLDFLRHIDWTLPKRKIEISEASKEVIVV